MTLLKIVSKGLFISLVGLLSCHNDTIPADTPSCVRDLISQMQNQPVRNPPGSVWRYQYNGKTVYYIPPTCCDLPSLLLDDTCTALCSPDGGLSGSGDGRCTDFSRTRQNGELVWQDTRK